MMIDFSKRVLFVGYGAVAHCTLPIFFKHLRVPCQNVTVLDFEDKDGTLAPWIAQGLRFVRQRITPDNLDTLLGQYLSTGDLLVDLAWNIDCCEIVEWCHDHGVLYINTSVEVWDPYAGAEEQHPTEKTLYWRHMNVRRMASAWKVPGPTAILEHGANPNVRTTIRKKLEWNGDPERERMHEYHNVTAIGFARQFQEPPWVNEAAITAIQEYGGC